MNQEKLDFPIKEIYHVLWNTKINTVYTRSRPWLFPLDR